MKIWSVLTITAFVSGCASLQEIHPLEYAWQAAHVVDALQTYEISREPDCAREGDPLTRLIIGEHPEKDRVYKWAIGTAIVHFLVWGWFDEKSPQASNVLRIGELALKADTIKSNADQGFKYLGGVSDKRHEACGRFKERLNNQSLNIIYRF